MPEDLVHPARASSACRATFSEFIWIWNHSQDMPTPDVHLRMARWLFERWSSGDRELLLLAFRSSGKSTLVGLFCAWLLLQDANLRILVLAGDLPLAKKMVRNVRRLIESHPLTGGLRARRSDQWAGDQFTVVRRLELRDPSMLAKGISANITGLRADAIVYDDVEVPKTSDTPDKREALRERLREAEFVLTPGGLRLYIGTPHTYYSIYNIELNGELGESEAFLSGYKRLEIPILDHRQQSAWPERFSLDRIGDMLSKAGPAKFESQMLLKARPPSDLRLDPERLRVYHDDLIYSESNRTASLTLGGRRLVSASCWWDPAYGAPEKGDANAVAAVFTDETGGYWLHRVQYLTHDVRLLDNVDEATQLCRQVASLLRDLHLPAIVVETNGIGRFLAGLLRQQIGWAGLRCSVLEQVSRTNKDLRILEAFDAVLAARRLSVHDSVLRSPFIQEMREWRPGARRCRDDGLDAVAGCLLSEPVRLPRLAAAPPREVSRGAWRGFGPFRAEGDFSP
ncbi:MAG: phage terminase large subunit [Rhodospirillales bacterium]|nr:phage terminase large subunit [Rhodospirillales bacterium]